MIKTGIQELDSFWNKGLQRGNLILIAARPGMGKTSFLLKIGSLISKKHKSLFFSIANSVKNLKRNLIFDSLILDDTPNLDLQNLVEKIASSNIEVVLIDHLELLNGNRDSLIHDLKKIAINLNICIIVNATIGREPEYRDLSARRPIIKDLTGNPILFNLTKLSNIDQLLFIYREKYYNSSTEKTDVLELIFYENHDAQIIKLDWNIFN